MVNNNPETERNKEIGTDQLVSADFERLIALVDKLKQLSDRINYYDIPKTNFSAILEDEKLLAVYHKDWSLVIGQMNFVRELQMLFLRDFERNPEQAISYIKTHLNEMLQLMQAFDQKEIMRFKRAILMASKLEIEELNKCIEDIKRWPNYRLTNGIEFFTQRLMLYLRGGKSNGDIFLGLSSHFKDIDLAREIFRVPEIKKLWTYKQEMEFFSWARYAIKKSVETEGSWKGFEDFYNNLRGGKNYIRIVRKAFGNPQFARLLEAFEEKKHEAPVDWEHELGVLSYTLNDPLYQNKQVIEPARQALLNLFHNAIDGLFKRKVELKEIDDILKSLERSIKDKLKKLRKHIAKLKIELENIDYQVDPEMDKIMPLLMEYMYTLGVMPERRAIKLRKISDLSTSWLNSYNTIARRLSADKPVPEGFGLFAASMMDNLSAWRLKLVNAPLLDRPFETDIAELERKINSELMPKLQKIIELIRRHDSEFKAAISSTTSLLPEIQARLMPKLKGLGAGSTKI